MGDHEFLLERALSLGYEKAYESADWTVLTKGEKFLAIESIIDASARLTGAYSELVAGSYEHIGTLLADLVRMKQDCEKICEQASRENAILMLAAFLLILGNAYYRSKVAGIEGADFKYLLASSLIILGVASLFSMIRGVETKRATMVAWPDRMKGYHLWSSALKQLDMEAEKK